MINAAGRAVATAADIDTAVSVFHAACLAMTLAFAAMALSFLVL
jgi:adenosylcobinamide-phosphate synthase